MKIKTEEYMDGQYEDEYVGTSNSVFEPEVFPEPDYVVEPEEVLYDTELGPVPTLDEEELMYDEPVISAVEVPFNTDYAQEDDVVILDTSEMDMYEGTESLGKRTIRLEKSFKLPGVKDDIILHEGDILHVVGGKSSNFKSSIFEASLSTLSGKKKYEKSVVGSKEEKVAVLGKNCVLVENTMEWKVPGTSIILEAGDVIQLISNNLVLEAKKCENDDEKDSDEEEDEKEPKEESKKNKKEADEEDMKDDEEEDDKEDDKDPKSEKKESFFQRRSRGHAQRK